MPRIIILALILQITLTASLAQVVSVNKFYHNGKEMEMVAHGVAYFSFNEFDTTLTNTAKEYLDIFGKY